MSRERDFGLDLARAGALFIVVTAHFFLNIGFYDVPMQGWVMALCALLRQAFLPAVSIFLFLSGWLCIGRTWSRRYLLGLLPVIFCWLICSVLTLVFRMFYFHEEYSLIGIVRRTLDYSAAPYSWYVEMYIGLYLMMPLLNAGWRGMDDSGKKATVLFLFALTSLNTFVNQGYKLLPSWWTRFYPVTFYLMGAWMREHPLKCRGVWLVLGWLGFAAVGTALRWYEGAGEPFTWAEYVDNNGFFTAMEGVFLFSLLSRCRGTHTPTPLRRLVLLLSRMSLPAYLLSYISDTFIYPILNAAMPDIAHRLPWLPVSVAAGLLFSTAAALPVDWLCVRLTRLARKLWDRFAEQKREV